MSASSLIEVNNSLLLSGLAVDECVGIVAQKVNGLGDISCALKFANDLHERVRIASERIIIVSSNDEDVRLFNHHSFKVINPEFDETSFAVGKVALLIVLPCDNSGLGLSFLHKGVPILSVTEYDQPPFSIHPQMSSHFRSVSLGLSKEYLGMMIDSELRNWGFSPDRFISEKRLKHLRALSPTLRQAVLGGDCSDELAFNFSKTNRLFFSYASTISSYYTFSQTILQMIAKRDYEYRPNITFIMPGFREYYHSSEPIDHPTFKVTEFKDGENSTSVSEEKEFAKQKFILPPDLYNTFRLFGICNIKVSRFEKDQLVKCHEYTAENISKENGIQAVHIITGTFFQQTIKKFFMSSERETIITGDQTFSEAVSANMNFVYEGLPHKDVLCDRLEKLGYGVLNSDFAEPFPEQFEKGINDPKKVTAINDALCKSKDYLPKIIAVMNEFLSKKTKSIPIIDPQLTITPGLLPFNTPTIVTLNQVSALSIDVTTNCSSLEAFKNSLFSPISLLHNRYLLIREPIQEEQSAE